MTQQTITRIKTLYERQGWCRLDHRLSDGEIQKLRDSVERHISERRPGLVYEEGSQAVRGIHGCHRFDPVCSDLTRLPPLVDVAEEILGTPAYVYQFKVNLKQPRDGAEWPWHQDFPFWQTEDGMPAPHAVNIAILLDDAHEHNGPVVLVPGSHRLGPLWNAAEDEDDSAADWRVNMRASLPLTVPGEVASRLAAERGTEVLTGPPGTIYVFHPCIVHSSSANLSADRRALLIISYNSVTNLPRHPNRPEFLVDRDSTPIVKLGRETL
ncbi:phytanoyl-CoA dioxygenase family protein [Nonomuraea sp. NPDC001831]|uniref:phytanoyl-CoA dioxygenase family protein n=1 Tax=Nonomuraea sp. NPDC001831 TaxID=3364340 RepID=UPI0036CDEB99